MRVVQLLAYLRSSDEKLNCQDDGCKDSIRIHEKVYAKSTCLYPHSNDKKGIAISKPQARI